MNRHRLSVARVFCFFLFATGTALCEVSRGSDGFLYAEVSVRKAAVPARFAAELLVVGSTHEAVAENKAREDAVLRLLYGTDIGNQDVVSEGE